MSCQLFRRIVIASLMFGFMFLKSECGFVSDVVTDSISCLSGVSVSLEPEIGFDDKTIKTVKEETDIVTYGYGVGDEYLRKYCNEETVRQIILVEQSDRNISDGFLYLFCKDDNNHWKLALACNAFLGKNGIDKAFEGDKKTPTGDFGFLMAFGVKDDPGSLIPYTKITNTMYLCGDKEYYNQFIDTAKVNHICSSNSEHLIRYVPQYNYALFIDYNKDCIYGKGSAIFLHCTGNYPYTLGCISLSEEHMVKIIRLVDSNARICIYANRIN